MVGNSTAVSRFFEKVELTLLCWEWRGSRSASGYGNFEVARDKVVYAHRFSYELLCGAIPDGLVVDHLCRNRLCVNPDHLEPVTQAENVRRGLAARGLDSRCSPLRPEAAR